MASKQPANRLRQHDPAALSDESLQAALATLDARIGSIEAEISSKARDLDVARSESELLRTLLRLRRGETEGEGDQVASAADGRGQVQRRGAAHPVVGHAIRELTDAGHPLHISELMSRLKARDVIIPGAGRQANLIAHLTRASEVVRPSRGMYALAEWDLPEAPKAPATRRRARGKPKGGDQ